MKIHSASTMKSGHSDNLQKVAYVRANTHRN